MASVDDLFKSTSQTNGKRKREKLVDPNVSFKTAKLTNGDVKQHSPAASDELQDEEAGPELPDDEEGRFFGGGITSGTAEILDYMEEQDDEAAVTIDSTWLRKTALNFEKHITKNAELRAKYENDPSKFMASEADLDADIKGLSTLADHPELFSEFSKLGCVTSLVNLLAHENTDISIDAVEIISELTDDEIAEQWDAIVNDMLEAGLLELLIQNLGRLDEKNESDQTGVYHIMSVIENLASKTSISKTICQSSIISWLLERIKGDYDQNKQYAMEILAILAQTPDNREYLWKNSAVDTLLQLASSYRRRDFTDELEYVENLWDCLICLAGRGFVEAEGVELCLIMIREDKLSKRSLKLLDHAQGPDVCERIVTAAGLKVIFGMFMKKQDGETVEHLLGIFYAMLRFLPGQSASRIRMLAKFVEKNFEKTKRLLQLRKEFKRKDSEYCIETTDVILAWLVAEDDGARHLITEQLGGTDETLGSISLTIQGQLDDMGEEGDESLRDMLSTLQGFLK